jgi:hypothetical protein
MKAKILGDTITPDFLYHVVEITGDKVRLGWNGRRGFWNETTCLLTEVLLVEDDSCEKCIK